VSTKDLLTSELIVYFFVYCFCLLYSTLHVQNLRSACTSACGQCQVQSCSNFFKQMLADENDDNNNDDDNAEMI